MSKPKIYLTRTDIPDCAIERLNREFDVQSNPIKAPVKYDDLVAGIKGKDGVMCMLTDDVDEKVITAAGPQLKIIATMSVGYDKINIDECKKRNIWVTNTPEVSAHSVAEMAVTLLIAGGRRMAEAADEVRRGNWIYPFSPLFMCGNGLTNSIVGFVGMGQIAQNVVEILRSCNTKEIIFYDKFAKTSPPNTRRIDTMEKMLSEADFIVSLVNLNPQTKHMFNKTTFSQMKKNAIFVNCARGGVVNHDDLYEALKNNTIRGAAIDVTEPEPIPKDHPLLTLPNCFITPHIASQEMQVRIAMAHLAIDNLVAVLKENKAAKTPVFQLNK